MTWENPSALLTKFRDQIAACSAWSPNTDAQIHYPKADLGADILPLIVLDETRNSRSYYAVGAGGLTAGSLRATIHADAGVTTNGQIETLARDIGLQLMAQEVGIFFRDFEVGLCSEPRPQDDRSIVSIELTVTYGISPP